MGLFGLLPDGAFQAASAMDPSMLSAPKKSFGFGDFLGILGDALLVGNDAEPRYSIGKAMQGYEADPMGAIKDVSRVSPSYGQKMLQQYMSDQLERQKEARASRSANISDRKNLDSIEGDFYDRVAGLMAEDNPATWGARAKAINDLAASRGLKLPIPIGDTYDPGTASAYKDLSLTRKEAAQLAEQQRYHDATIANQAANTNIRRQQAKASVINNAARTRIQAATQGANAVTNAAGKVIQANKPAKATSSGGIQRPGASAATPSKPFIIQGGKILKRQADGSYK